MPVSHCVVQRSETPQMRTQCKYFSCCHQAECLCQSSPPELLDGGLNLLPLQNFRGDSTALESPLPSSPETTILDVDDEYPLPEFPEPSVEHFEFRSQSQTSNSDDSFENPTDRTRPTFQPQPMFDHGYNEPPPPHPPCAERDPYLVDHSSQDQRPSFQAESGELILDCNSYLA